MQERGISVILCAALQLRQLVSSAEHPPVGQVLRHVVGMGRFGRATSKVQARQAMQWKQVRRLLECIRSGRQVL